MVGAATLKARSAVTVLVRGTTVESLKNKTSLT